MAQSKYQKLLVDKPKLEVALNQVIKGRQHPPATYMSNDLVENSNTYIEMGWIWGMPDKNPYIPEHTHDYDEIVLHIGSDINNPDDLGAEIEFYVNGEKLIVNKTSALFVPKGLKHGPLVWKRVDRPHLEITIMLGAGKVEQAKPGGYDPSKSKR